MKKETYKLIRDINRIFGNIPVNVIKLANAFGFDVLELKESNDRTYKSSLRFNIKYVQNENELRGTIYIDTIDPYNQRVAIAYHLSNVILLSCELIEFDDFEERIDIEKSIPDDNGYYMALSLLCPVDKLKRVLANDGFDKNNFYEITNPSRYVKIFGIGAIDFLKYLRFVFWDGGFKRG